MADPIERPASLFGNVGGSPTLGDLIAAWEGLAAHAEVACPVCAGEMTPRYGAGAAVIGGRCSSCGSTLA